MTPTCTWCKGKISDDEWKAQNYAILNNRYFHDHNKPELGQSCKEAWLQHIGESNATVQPVSRRDKS